MIHFRRSFSQSLFPRLLLPCSSVREDGPRFNAAVTVLNACKSRSEYISGPAPDAPCDSQERPTFFSPALQEMRINKSGA